MEKRHGFYERSIHAVTRILCWENPFHASFSCCFDQNVLFGHCGECEGENCEVDVGEGILEEGGRGVGAFLDGEVGVRGERGGGGGAGYDGYSEGRRGGGEEGGEDVGADCSGGLWLGRVC
jgi:hypothetical protein